LVVEFSPAPTSSTTPARVRPQSLALPVPTEGEQTK
jgi:hypothetical protein